MGMRYVQLNNTFTGNSNGSATLHVSNLSPNPSLLVPGPALLFVIVSGTPSIGQMVMVGNGIIGTQPTSLNALLPNSTTGGFIVTSTYSSASASATGSSTPKSSAGRLVTSFFGLVAVFVGVTVLL